jgi:hypothetical protein
MNYTEQAYDIIVLAGQSNAQGTGRGCVLNEYMPDGDIISLSPIYSISRTIENEISKRAVIYSDEPFLFDIASERVVNEMKNGDLSLTFARCYKNNGYLRSGRKLLIIRAAIGATGFMHGQWGINSPLYNKMCEMLDYALSLNKDNKLVALLWHQGEHEVGKGNPPQNYKNQLMEMLLDFKVRFKAPHLPIITADFSKKWKAAKREKADAISTVIKEVVTELGGIFIDTSGLLSNSEKNGDDDVIHFCRESLYILGEMYFNEYRALVQAK